MREAQRNPSKELADLITDASWALVDYCHYPDNERAFDRLDRALAAIIDHHDRQHPNRFLDGVR